MLKKWFPMNYIIKRAAKSYGFIDPLKVMARIRQFSQPSEVQEPIELIRAGVVFHARGLINTRAIQYNLDWVWPFWVVKQFRPNDSSFIPRGFSFSHVNLTHRNWTAVGLPNEAQYPIVDPRGLVTPLLDSWSVDFWVLSDDGRLLLPSQCSRSEQTADFSEGVSVFTKFEENGMSLKSRVHVIRSNGQPQLVMTAGASAGQGGYLIVSLRPYNPEGIQFIDHIQYDEDESIFLINSRDSLQLDQVPDRIRFSNYSQGDVSAYLNGPSKGHFIECPIGMATAAACFRFDGTHAAQIEARMELRQEKTKIRGSVAKQEKKKGWADYMNDSADLQVPDEKIRFLYEAAVRTLILLSADETFPGPYTYKRFWFRDSCFMINALLAIGLSRRSERLIKRFLELQTPTGYFRSQEGEWDSNGQVLWIADRLQSLSGCLFDGSQIKSFIKGARWIEKKRMKRQGSTRCRGLLPAGFSAEHLGPNDYYFWDNFWGLAGFRAAAQIAKRAGLGPEQKEMKKNATRFEKDIFDSIAQIPDRMKNGAVPASPYRRMDAGAVGSLVADYPLQITEAGDPRIMKTVSYLMENCFYSGAFFQDMIHSGINIYLTLEIAQTLLRAGRLQYRDLMDKVADLASPTGQWPEAIHPNTRGGCMGDGQHGWAAAEWIMMIRNLFVREEKERLIIGSGIYPGWVESGELLMFGPTLVSGASITIKIRQVSSKTAVCMDIDSTDSSVRLPCDIAIPGYQGKSVSAPCQNVRVAPV